MKTKRKIEMRKMKWRKVNDLNAKLFEKRTFALSFLYLYTCIDTYTYVLTVMAEIIATNECTFFFIYQRSLTKLKEVFQTKCNKKNNPKKRNKKK